MANVKKGTLTRPPQWWKHLRDWKRVFWKSERSAQKKEIKMRCDTCGEDLKENGLGCDWRQGRCPHRHPMFNEIVLNNYKMRYYNLVQTIKGWFK